MELYDVMLARAKTDRGFAHLMAHMSIPVPDDDRPCTLAQLIGSALLVQRGDKHAVRCVADAVAAARDRLSAPITLREWATAAWEVQQTLQHHVRPPKWSAERLRNVGTLNGLTVDIDLTAETVQACCDAT